MRDPVRLHVEDMLEEGAVIRFEADRAHYLRHVMRARDGEAVTLFGARSGEWRAVLALPGRHDAQAVVQARTRPPEAEGLVARPALLFSPPKRDAAETIVRMATELGVGEIRPVLTERCVARAPNLERWHAIAREAAEQCERLSVPVLHGAVPLGTLLATWPASRGIAVAAERRKARALGESGGTADALLVGPEGGFTPGELDALLARPFVQAVSLGPLELRADTAAAAGLALLGAEHAARPFVAGRRTDQES